MRKAKKKAIISLLMSLLVSTSIVFSGCNGCNGCSDGGGDTPSTEDTSAMEKTNIDMLKDGRTDYKLVVPENMLSNEAIASEEFVYFFKQATDIDIPVIKDTGLTHDANAKYFSLGNTTLLQSTDITLNSLELNYDGGKIITKDSTVYLAGATDYGTLMMVYTFMETTFNYDTYAQDCMVIDKGITDMKLYKYDVTDVPSFRIRYTSHAVVQQGSTYGNRMRRQYDKSYMPIYQNVHNDQSGSEVSHNTDQFLPPKKEIKDEETGEVEAVYYENGEWGNHADYYDQYNTYWFSNAGNQLCYTARGNQDAYNAMVEICAAKVEYSLKRYPRDNFPMYVAATLTQEDNSQYCTCEACEAKMKEHAGSRAGAMIILLNDVMEKVSAWMELPENADYKREDFKLIMYAYGWSIDPPAVKDENGEWQPCSEEVVFREDTGIYYANQYFDYQQAVSSQTNDRQRDILDGWAMLTDNIFVWLYNANFSSLFYFYDSFDFFYYGGGLEYIANYTNNYMYIESTYGGGTYSAFNNLRLYLDYKMMWNAEADAVALTDKFFDAMYKGASGTMRELFNDYRQRYAYIAQENAFYKENPAWNKLAVSEFWPMALLEQWVAKIDEALCEIEYLKDLDEKLYVATYGHIEAEVLFPLYAMINLHDAYIQPSVKQGYIDRMKNYITTYNVTTIEVVHGGGMLVDWLNNL